VHLGDKGGLGERESILMDSWGGSKRGSSMWGSHDPGKGKSGQKSGGFLKK